MVIISVFQTEDGSSISPYPLQAVLAPMVEQAHGKGEVIGSNPIVGTINRFLRLNMVIYHT